MGTGQRKGVVMHGQGREGTRLQGDPEFASVMRRLSGGQGRERKAAKDEQR